MTITRAEYDLLRHFVYHAKRLEDHSLVNQQGIIVNVNFRYEVGLPGSVTQYRVNEELLESLLTRLRIFYSDSEKITLNRMLNIIWREFKDDFTICNVRELRKLLKHSPIAIVVGGHKMSSNHIWEDFLYAERLHADMERKKRLRDLQAIEPMMYADFLHTTLNRIEAVLWTANYLLHRVPGSL